MDVSVDQSRHDGPSRGVDDVDVAATQRPAVLGDLDDGIPFDSQRGPGPELRRFDIEEPGVPDDLPGHGASSPRDRTFPPCFAPACAKALGNSNRVVGRWRDFLTSS